MARRRRYNLEEDIGISEEQLRQNLQLLPQQARPSKGYRVLHGINVFLRIVILILILILLFRIQKTDVQGNENITDEQIMTWIGEDKKALNSLYAIYKYNVRQEELNPAIARTRLSFRLPWYVKIKVTEFPAVGMVENAGGSYTFNGDGLIIANSQVDDYGTLVSGVKPTVTTPFQKIEFEDPGMTDQILSMINSLDRNMMEPDEMIWLGDEDGWQLRFGSTWANLGTSVPEEKIQELAALYTEVKNREGIIHLEYYEPGDEIVRFEQGLPEEDYDEEDDTY